MTTTYHHSAAFNDLAALLTGQLFLPAAYEQVRQLWNGVKTQPASLVVSPARCHSYRSLDKDTWAAPLGSSGRTRYCWTSAF